MKWHVLKLQVDELYTGMVIGSLVCLQCQGLLVWAGSF
jgi:hypothetical protein